MVESTVERFKILMRHLLPIYEQTQYKGNGGKIAVVGGSVTYTGAPYYSAMSGLKAGSDLSHVFCVKEAALPIKSYSPEIVVHALDETKPLDTQLSAMFPLANSIVVGPGLGREPISEAIIESVVACFLDKL